MLILGLNTGLSHAALAWWQLVVYYCAHLLSGALVTAAFHHFSLCFTGTCRRSVITAQFPTFVITERRKFEKRNRKQFFEYITYRTSLMLCIHQPYEEWMVLHVSVLSLSSGPASEIPTLLFLKAANVLSCKGRKMCHDLWAKCIINFLIYFNDRLPPICQSGDIFSYHSLGITQSHASSCTRTFFLLGG